MAWVSWEFLRGVAAMSLILAFIPDRKHLATGGFDGSVRLFEAATGKLARAFVPVPVAGSVAMSA
jgi:hypothetical protein